MDVGATDIYAVTFSPGGKRAAVATTGSFVSLWNAPLASKQGEFTAHAQETWGLAFSPDGATLATGGADNIARLWDTATWSVTHELQHKPMTADESFKNAVLCAAFSPDGRTLVTGGLDGAVTFWLL